jgi:predicted metal-dependent hydrolase
VALTQPDLPLYATPPPRALPRPVRVIRSARRRRTISARLRGEVIEVLLPEGLSPDEEAHWIEVMSRRLTKRRTPAGDQELMARAMELSRRHFGGALEPASVRWSETQQLRWGSCTPETGAIRLSARMRDFPRWVVDYVLVHELAHLRYLSHGPRFWALVERYPLTERARGYLIAKGGEAD